MARGVKSFEEQVADLVEHQERMYERGAASELGPPPEADAITDRDKVRAWTRRNPNLTPEIEQQLHEAYASGQITSAQYIDGIYPWRRKVYAELDDVEERLKEAERVARLAAREAAPPTPELAPAPEPSSATQGGYG